MKNNIEKITTDFKMSLNLIEIQNKNMQEYQNFKHKSYDSNKHLNHDNYALMSSNDKIIKKSNTDKEIIFIIILIGIVFAIIII